MSLNHIIGYGKGHGQQAPHDRQERGILIAATKKIQRKDAGWIVPSQFDAGTQYIVDGETCSCPDFETRGVKCKHQWAVEYVVTRETAPDGTTRVQATTRVTYSQEWSSYNAAQTNEERVFGELLQSLCAGIPQPEQTHGRPRLPLSDVVFALVSKVYAGKSGRRFMSSIRNAETAGLVAKAPHYNSAFRYLESPDLTPLLKTLIEQSAAPLRAIETDFALDSSGFSTTTYERWFDHKWGKMRSHNKWIKAHLMCGVSTNVVTSVEVTPTESADAPFLKPLVDATARTFEVHEVSADKAYSSRKNLHAVQAVGGTPYIPFKANTNGVGKSFDGLWSRMWHYYQFNRGAFLSHYHKRSNAETTFSMIKTKFGGAVRAKMPTAQVNEVLCKILAHNLCVLIASVYELGLEPVFWTSEAERPPAPILPLERGY
jgi:transposase